MARLSTGPEAAAPDWRVQLEQQQHAKVVDDDPDDEDDEDDDDDDEDDEEDDDDELDEDEAKAELKRIRAALTAANAQGAKRRTSVKTLKTQLAKAQRDLAAARVTKPKTKADDDKGGGGDVDVEAIKAATKLEADTAAEVKVKRAEARGALRGAGVKSELLDRAVRTLDLDDLDVDDDGNVDGLDEAIADLRKAVPSLFGGKPAAKRRSVAGPSDRDGESGPKLKKLTTSEIQAKQARGEVVR